MSNTELDNMINLYESPSIEVIEMTGAEIICFSGTESYGVNNDHELGDDDFE